MIELFLMESQEHLSEVRVCGWLPYDWLIPPAVEVSSSLSFFYFGGRPKTSSNFMVVGNSAPTQDGLLSWTSVWNPWSVSRNGWISLLTMRWGLRDVSMYRESVHYKIPFSLCFIFCWHDRLIFFPGRSAILRREASFRFKHITTHYD